MGNGVCCLYGPFRHMPTFCVRQLFVVMSCVLQVQMMHAVHWEGGGGYVWRTPPPSRRDALFFRGRGETVVAKLVAKRLPSVGKAVGRQVLTGTN